MFISDSFFSYEPFTNVFIKNKKQFESSTKMIKNLYCHEFMLVFDFFSFFCQLQP